MFSKLDRIDKKLLATLDIDSRQSFSALARTLRLGNDLIEYRVSRYVELGIIEKFSVVADPFSTGWWVVKNYVKLKSNQNKLNILLSLVKKNKASYWVAEFHGRYDLLFSFAANSPKDCKNFEENFKDKSSDSIIDYQVAIPTRITRFNKKYINNTKPKEYVFSPSEIKAHIDNLDLKLLSLLYENARYSLTDLSKELSLTPTAISNRIKKLEEQHVILGYRFQLNFDVFGYLFFKLLLQLSDLSIEFRNRLYQFCSTHPNITCFIEQIGQFPIEIEVEVANYQALNQFVDDFRRKFDSGIIFSETLMIKKDHLHRFPSTEN